MKNMWDAAFIPDVLPPGFDAAAFYLGGSSAFHTWSRDDVSKLKHLKRLPIWVPTLATDHPRTTAYQVRDACYVLGIPPSRNRVMIDVEARFDAQWVDAYANHLYPFGYETVVYGSIDTLFLNPERKGYFVADPTGLEHLYNHEGVVGTQYAINVEVTGGTVDLDVITDELFDHLWSD